MPIGTHQQGFSEFNTAVKLPRPLTPEVFTTSIHRAIGLIEAVVGGSHPLVEYLKRELPLPMFDKDAWQQHFGRLIASDQQNQHSRIEVRPDLVFYPLMMVSVLVHEATHALDPLVCEAVQIGEELKVSDEKGKVFQEQLYIWKKMELRAELQAVEAEIAILPLLVPPKGALQEQVRYLNEQRAAVVAMRITELAHVEAGIALLKFSQQLNAFIDDEVGDIPDNVVENTQALLEFLLNRSQSGVVWADKAVAQFEAISGEIVTCGVPNHHITYVLQTATTTLENSRKKFNDNVWLASKVKMPRLPL